MPHKKGHPADAEIPFPNKAIKAITSDGVSKTIKGLTPKQKQAQKWLDRMKLPKTHPDQAKFDKMKKEKTPFIK